MAEQLPEVPDALSSTILRRDIPPELVDFVLDEQRQVSLDQRYHQQWLALWKRPNVRHYISVTSYEAAPDDPDMRGRVTKAMLGMLALLDEAKTSENLEELLANSA